MQSVAPIVYDMQAGIIQPMKNGAGITAQMKRVLDSARLAAMRVFHTVWW